VTATIGELCAGYGGLGMGVSRVIDAEVAWYSEIDKGALKVLGHRFPGVPNIGDMTTVDWSSASPVDVLTAGTPCQDLSHAGKRAGMTEGTRSNLWVAMREAIAVLRPSLVVWENVGGAYSAEADSDLERREGRLGDRSGRPALRALGRVLGDLASLGYVGGWHGLRAAAVGAPHGRLRVFVVAYPKSNQGWLKHGDGAAATSHNGRGHARLGRQPTDDGNPWDDADGRRGAALLPSPRTSDTNGAGTHGDGGLDLRTAVTMLPTPRATDGTKGGPNQRGSSGDLMLPSAEAHGQISGQYRAQMANALTRWGDYADAIARWEHITRPAPEPTMLSRKGTPQLSPAFSEWMMGLPAGWVTDAPGITRNEALRALGNGVVPQQAAAAVAFLLDVLMRSVPIS
jgi:DNA (cytosine-5)-methyltransferase 1